MSEGVPHKTLVHCIEVWTLRFLVSWQQVERQATLNHGGLASRRKGNEVDK